MQDEYRAFDSATSSATGSDEVWKALQAFSAAVVGHRLFTVMTVDMNAGLARRAYTDHPAEYPVSGTKPIVRNRWFDIVHREKRSFVANTLGEIAVVFPDHELIASLGCGSVLNLPLIVRNELVATINLLDAEGHYTEERVAAAQSLLPVPAKLCWALAARFDSTAEKTD